MREGKVGDIMKLSGTGRPEDGASESKCCTIPHLHGVWVSQFSSVTQKVEPWRGIHPEKGQINV
jgi:hypothetical protein